MGALSAVEFGNRDRLGGGCGLLLHERLGDLGFTFACRGQAVAEFITYAAQLGYAGDDTGLFDKWWERHQLLHIFALCKVPMC